MLCHSLPIPPVFENSTCYMVCTVMRIIMIKKTVYVVFNIAELKKLNQYLIDKAFYTLNEFVKVI